MNLFICLDAKVTFWKKHTLNRNCSIITSFFQHTAFSHLLGSKCQKVFQGGKKKQDSVREMKRYTDFTIEITVNR